MAANFTIKVVSSGAWQGDNPLDFAFPLLIVQTILVLAISRVLTLLLKPIRQPKVIAEILGGILLGPTALGRNSAYMHRLFPDWSRPILHTVSEIGLLFFLFLVGLELDVKSIRRSGRRAFFIAAAGISFPFTLAIGITFLIRATVPDGDSSSYGASFVFIGVALSITAFPVLARILAELKLLTTEIGETALSAAAFNDVAAWVMLALAVAISGGDHHRSPLVALYVLLSGSAFVLVELVVVAPIMRWVAKKAEEGGGAANEVWICLTLAGVLVSGFVTDLIGIHAICGAFVFGLTIPKEGEFAGKLIEKMEDFVSGLLLPLYFASSGLETNFTKLHGASVCGLLGLVIATSCVGKIGGTFLVAVTSKFPLREALTLGLLMNTKGLVELIVLNIGKEKEVLNNETFAVMVVMALFNTFLTTPLVAAIYKGVNSNGSQRKFLRLPSSTSHQGRAADPTELRLVACVHTQRDAPSVISVIEAISGSVPKTPIRLYILHLVELTERISSILLFRRSRHNGVPFSNQVKKELRDQVSVAFAAYSQLGRVRMRTMTAVSSMATIHEDVCLVANTKRAALLVVPFHKHGTAEGTEMENVGSEWRMVNQLVLLQATCSVAVLIDRGSAVREPQVGVAEARREVCVFFFGGPDDREALEIAGRMVKHPGVRVSLVRFVGPKNPTVVLRPSSDKSADRHYTFSTAAITIDWDRQQELDEEAVDTFKKQTEGAALYQERPAANAAEAVLELGRSGQYELLVVGKGRVPSPTVAEMAGNLMPEHPELGPIGDLLSSSIHGIRSSVLVVQQHDEAYSEVTPISMELDHTVIQIGKGTTEEIS